MDNIQKKHLSYNFEVKSFEDKGIFTGYASVFDVIDSQRDIVMRGAFSRSIKEKGAGDVKLLWQHKPDEPIGVFLDMKEDARGLFVRGRLLMDVQRAKEAYGLMENGVIKGLSIGFSVVDAEYNDDAGIRFIKDLDLWEVSLVTFPANESAGITGFKNGVPATVRDFEKFLRKSGFSRNQAKAIASFGFKDAGNAELVGSIEKAMESLVG